MLRTTKFALLIAGALVVAACDESGNDDDDDSAQGIETLGSDFVAAFNADPNDEPFDAQDVDLGDAGSTALQSLIGRLFPALFRSPAALPGPFSFAVVNDMNLGEPARHYPDRMRRERVDPQDPACRRTAPCRPRPRPRLQRGLR